MKKLFVFAGMVLIACSGFFQKPLTWVAIGDSITWLCDHQEETNNRISQGYLQMLTKKLSYISYVNKGLSGWTTGNIADQAERLGIPPADVYSILLGTNDWWQGRPIGSWNDYANNTGSATVYGSFKIIINKIRSLNARAKIILVTPMQRTDFVYLWEFHNNAFGSYKKNKGQSLSQVADAVKDIAIREHCDLVDLYYKSGMTPDNLVKFKRLKNPATGLYQNYTYPAYTSVPFNPDADQYPYPPESINYTYDGLHPSEKGHAVIANMLYEVMKKY